MIKYTIAFFAAISALYSAKEVDIFAGSGLAWSSWQNGSAIGFPRTESNIEGRVPMRETYLSGFRFTHLEDYRPWVAIVGVELSHFYSAPTVTGAWKFVQLNADGNISYESRQANTSATVPLINAVHLSGMWGIRREFLSVFAIEGSVHFGGGVGRVKYEAIHPDGSGRATGSTLPAFQIGARLGVKIFITNDLALGLEARSLYGWIDNLGRSTSRRSVHIAAHMLLVSITHQFP